MADDFEWKSFPAIAGRALALASTYCAVGWLGLLLAIPPGYATVFWPASGIALAAVYIYGYGILGGVFLGSVVLNLFTGLSHGQLPGPALAANAVVIGAGSMLQVGAGVYLLRRYIGSGTRFERLGQILRFVLLGGPVSCLIAATCGASILLITRSIPPDAAFFTWWTWYTGDVLGIVAFSPLLVLLFDRSVAAEDIAASLARIRGIFSDVRAELLSVIDNTR